MLLGLPYQIVIQHIQFKRSQHINIQIFQSSYGKVLQATYPRVRPYNFPSCCALTIDKCQILHHYWWQTIANLMSVTYKSIMWQPKWTSMKIIHPIQSRVLIIIADVGSRKCAICPIRPKEQGYNNFSISRCGTTRFCHNLRLGNCTLGGTDWTFNLSIWGSACTGASAPVQGRDGTGRGTGCWGTTLPPATRMVHHHSFHALHI